MVDDTQKASLENDFKRKRESYYRTNYEIITFQNSLRRERRDQINQWIEQVDDKSQVLDVGCGPAILYPEAYSKCANYFAMDLVESNLEEVTQSNVRARTIRADLDNLEWEHEAPTLIICSGCIEFSQEGANNVKRLTKILAPNGSMIVTFPNLFSSDDVVSNISGLVGRSQYYYVHRNSICAESQCRIDHAKKFDLKHMAKKFKYVYRSIVKAVV